MPGSDLYPQSSRERDRWIVDLRPQGNDSLDPRHAYAAIAEQEPDEAGRLNAVATLFLTNRQCPWRCVMCDLWRNTLAVTVPRGAILEQIDEALKSLPPVQQVKLYNAGSFFDPGAIPPADYAEIAERMAQYERVIVECHPALVGPSALEFRDRLGECELEIAMGLETAHPEALNRLNKKMTVKQFARAARFCRENRIAVRVFLMIHPPFIATDEQAKWLDRSIDVAFDCGASVVSLVPARGGNGAMEQLAAMGQFTPPTLAQIENSFEGGLVRRNGLAVLDYVDTGERVRDRFGGPKNLPLSQYSGRGRGVRVFGTQCVRPSPQASPKVLGEGERNLPPILSCNAGGTPVPENGDREPGKYPNDGRIFVDLWDLERFSRCIHCFPRRHDRLATMNLEQKLMPRIRCEACEVPSGPGYSAEYQERE